MFTTNRYDKLMAKQKKIRSRIEKITNRANAKVTALQIKINHTRYESRVKCDDLNNKLKDAISLTENEVTRIYKENKDLFITE